jgi:1-phosphatidylinositol phosphodiesterase
MNIRKLAGVCLLVGCTALPAAAATQNGYSHDGNVKTTKADWMSSLADSTHLSQISMPGTHDTMSFYGGDAVQTQSLSLDNQLTSGIRALDIRCVINDKEGFDIYHGDYSQHATFDDVLDSVTAFLNNHPREVVLMRVRKEHNDDDDSQFETIYGKYLANESYSSYFWSPSPATFLASAADTNPTLGSVRGKIVVLQEFVSTQDPPVLYGISYTSLNIQDNYHLISNWDLYHKWDAVRDHLANANGKTPSNQLWANYLSGSGGSFPYFVASGKSSPGTNDQLLLTGSTESIGIIDHNVGLWPDFPRVSCLDIFGTKTCSITFLGTNQLTVNWLTNRAVHHIGLIYADFPGPDLIDRVISSQ